MPIKGVIFDFNGTLYWDTEINNEAWSIFLNQHGIYISREEMLEQIQGINNQQSIYNLFGGELSKDMIHNLSLEKEKIYREISLSKNPQLAPGAEDFFKFLKNKEIKTTIASASIIENIDYYFENFPLKPYFNKADVVYNDGIIKSKPHPDYYIKAMQNLGLSKEETMVFEDSYAGISSAENAGIENIIIVNSNNDDYSNWNYQIINDFSQVDKNLF